MTRLFCLLFFMHVGVSWAQSPPLSSKSKKAIEFFVMADNYRVRGQLEKAEELLNQAIEKDRKFEEAYYRLAVTQRSRGNYLAAIKSFETGLSLVTDLSKQKIYWYQLADIYLKNGDYVQSLSKLASFLQSEKVDKVKIDQALVWRGQCQYALDHGSEKYLYSIKPLSDTVNKFPMQYFPTLSANDSMLIFTVRYGKEHDDNEDLFMSVKDQFGRWKEPVPLSDQVNSTFREGASTISADGRKIIFTICGPKGCDLVESEKIGDRWRPPTNLGSAINTIGWEAQPSLSADGNELYFVSDRKGGVGGYDIWYSRRGADGKWRKAVNAGTTVNTRFDEIAPYIHVSNQNLYYASNGLPGFGGYDIYMSERRGEWSQPINMGAPLNDFHDQYSFTVSGKGEIAYYSKEQGRNQSKIYQTYVPEEFRIKQKANVIEGIVRDSQSKRPIKAFIELFDLKTGQKISEFSSDSVNGRYLAVLPGEAEYALHVVKSGYLFESLNFNYQNGEASKGKRVDVFLKPIFKDSASVLNNVFFELNEYLLDQKSKLELDEVALFLRKNPSISVEIAGHTDNLGTEEFNNKLSSQRAQSVVQYLMQAGIELQRLTFKGYGSKKPVRPNDTDENRRQNRRIEILIKSI